MKIRLLVEFDLQTKRWSAVFPELPGCATAGDSEEEAIANAKEALSLWFKSIIDGSGLEIEQFR
jgi:predicted RNase H-like HicB family nuclease